MRYCLMIWDESARRWTFSNLDEFLTLEQAKSAAGEVAGPVSIMEVRRRWTGGKAGHSRRTQSKAADAQLAGNA